MHVHQTNDEATLSKRSASKMGYFNDSLLKHFCKKLSRRTTLINRVYAYRVKLVRKLLQDFLDSFHGKIQVVNIGCGFDSGMFVSKLSEEHDLQYFELDLAQVLERKEFLLRKAMELKDDEINTNFIEMILQRTSFVPCDLSNPSLTINLLLSRGFSPNVPTLFIAECVLQYVNPGESFSLLQQLSEHFQSAASPAAVVIFDQARPDDAFGEVMQRNLKKRSSELHGIARYCSAHALLKRLVDAGWNAICAPLLDAIDFLRQSDEADFARMQNLEDFDEFEDYFETCRHYCLSVGTVNMQHTANIFTSSIKDLSRCWTSEISVESACVDSLNGLASSIQRESGIQFAGYGHVSIGYTSALQGSRILTFGGFSKKGHRTDSARIFSVQRKSEVNQWFQENKPGARMHHALCELFSVQLWNDALQAKSVNFVLKTNSINIHRTNQILAFGGRGSPRSAFNDTFIFDCDSERWSKLQFSPDDPIPSPRYRHRMVSIGISGLSEESFSIRTNAQQSHLCVSEKIYVGSALLFGGCESSQKFLNDLWVFCSVAEKWFCLQQSGEIPTPRHSHAMCYSPISKRLYVSGGISQDGTVMSDFYSLDITTLRWEKHLNTNASMQLFSHTMTYLENLNAILVIGGVAPQSDFWASHSVIRLFNLQNHSLVSIGQLPQVCGHQTVYIPEVNSVYVIAGGLQCFSFGSTYNHTYSIQFFCKSPHRARQMTVIDCGNCSIRPDDWKNNLYPRRLPVHFANCLLGDCVEKWSNVNYLSEKLKDVGVIVHALGAKQMKEEVFRMDFIDKNFEYVQQPFQELMENCFMLKKPTYFRSIARKDGCCDINSNFPAIAFDFEIPPFFHREITQEHHFQSCLRVSSAGIQLWTHYDIMDNILCQIVGEKRVVLFPPDVYADMKMNGSVSQALDVEELESRHKDRVIHAVLKPGDILFIPALWFHSVTTLTPSLGVNVFWRHLSSDAYSANDNYGNHDLTVMVKVKDFVLREIKQQLQIIPQDYQKFTLLQIADELTKL